MGQDRTVSFERERTGSTKSLKSRHTEAGTNIGTDKEAERILQDTAEEDENNKSIVTRAALLERMEPGSITGSTLNKSRKGGRGS